MRLLRQNKAILIVISLTHLHTGTDSDLRTLNITPQL